MAAKRLKSWNSAQYVVVHPSNSALETCKACATDYECKKADLVEAAATCGEDTYTALARLEKQYAASYWNRATLTHRLAHLASCSQVSQDIRDMADARIQNKKRSKASKRPKQSEDENPTPGSSAVEPKKPSDDNNFVATATVVLPEPPQLSEESIAKEEDAQTILDNIAEIQYTSKPIETPAIEHQSGSTSISSLSTLLRRSTKLA